MYTEKNYKGENPPKFERLLLCYYNNKFKNFSSRYGNI